MASMNRRRPRGSEERGAALVEFALVLPLLLVVIAGIVDFAFLFQRYEVITNAAREGARLASLSSPGTYDDTAVKDHVRNYVMNGLAMNDLSNVMPTSPDAVVVAPVNLTVDLGSGATADVPARRVTITYKHTFLLLGPILGLINGDWGNEMDIVATSQMRLELAASGGGS